MKLKILKLLSAGNKPSIGKVELSLNDEKLTKDVTPLLNQLMKSGTLAMKARGKKLLSMLR